MSEKSERGEAATDGAAEPQPIQPRDDGSGDQTKGTEFVGGVGGEDQAGVRPDDDAPAPAEEPSRPLDAPTGAPSDDDKPKGDES